MYICIYIYIYNLHIFAAVSNGKGKMEAWMIFLNLFTIYSSCKQKFYVCPFVYEETNGSYLFANGLKELSGLNGIAHASCPYRMSTLHVHAVCSCCMSLADVLQHVHASCLCCMTAPHAHVNAACPWCISILYVRTACPCCVSCLILSVCLGSPVLA
jgi:hypothetical protein